MAKNDKYLKPVVHVYPNAVVRVHYPDISDEENDKRCEAAMDAAVRFMLSLREKYKEEPAK